MANESLPVIKSKTLRRLGLIQNWNLPLLVFVLPFYLLFTILFDAVINSNASWLWVVTFISATLVEVAFVVICKKLFLTRLLTRHPSGLIGGSFAGIVNIVRNLFVAWLALQLGLLTQVDWLQRALGAYFMGVALIVLFVSVMGSRIEHAATVTRLHTLQRFLVQQRADSRPLLDAENLRLLQRTQTLLLPRIQRVQELLLSKNEKIEVLKELRELVTQKVRPLSSELSSTAKNLTLKPAPAVVPRVPVEFMTAKVNLKQVLRPGLILMFAGSGQWVMMQLLSGTAQANNGLIGVFAGWLFLVVAKLVIPAHTVVKRGVAICLLILLSAISGLPVFLYNVNSSSNLGELAMYSMLIIAPIFATLGFAISSSLDSARVEAEFKIHNDNDALARETALFDQRMWLAKRSWSFVVHGTVQAALTAAITRLSADGELEQYQINLVLEDLNRAKDALSTTPVLDIDLPTAMNALTSTWKGICEVQWTISPRAQRALVRDVDARICVNEISKEAISNAVRHGEAKRATVEIDRGTDELLFIKITNDGRYLPAKPAVGIGGQMLEELTLWWDLRNDRGANRVVLEAQLPISIISVGDF